MSKPSININFEDIDAGNPGSQAATEVILRYALSFIVLQLKKSDRVSVLQDMKHEIAAELATVKSEGSRNSSDDFQRSANNVLSRVFDTLIAQHGSE
jgi:uncharacterized protein YehS (DUF1456 family)